MRPKECRESGQKDLFKARLDQIVDLDHALVKLAQAVDLRIPTKSPGHSGMMPPMDSDMMSPRA